MLILLSRKERLTYKIIPKHYFKTSIVLDIPVCFKVKVKQFGQRQNVT